VFATAHAADDVAYIVGSFFIFMLAMLGGLPDCGHRPRLFKPGAPSLLKAPAVVDAIDAQCIDFAGVVTAGGSQMQNDGPTEPRPAKHQGCAE
jgi:hypothetical protein